MSYVHKKIRVFKEAGDIELHRKRSDGRMKTYTSATDARAWCDSTEDRRQHILDLIRQGDGKGLSLGKYIPIEAIIDILLANKNADIKRLQKEIEELKRFIRENGLKYEEKPVSVIEPARALKGSDTDIAAKAPKEDLRKTRSSPDTDIKARKEAEDAAARRAAEEAAARKAAEDAAARKAAEDAAAAKRAAEEEAARRAAEEAARRKAAEEEAERERERKRKEAEMAGMDDSARRAAEEEEARRKAAEAAAAEEEARRRAAEEAARKAAEEEEARRKAAEEAARKAAQDELERQNEEECKRAAERQAARKAAEAEGKPPERAAETPTTSSTPFTSDSSDYDTPAKTPRYPEEDEKAAKALLAGKSPDDQLRALKGALAEAEAYHKSQDQIAREAIEQLENIKDIVEGGDGVHPQRGSKGKAMEKGAFRPTTGIDDHIGSCKEEIDILEREIASMKSRSSPEADIIQREVQVLKRYCATLAAIQKENAELKRERDMLKDGMVGSADGALKDKLAKLDEITQERDRLRARVAQLEKELSGYGGLPAEVDTFKERSLALDSLREDEGNLRSRLNSLTGLEDEVKKLRDRVSLLEKQPGAGAGAAAGGGRTEAGPVRFDDGDREALLAKLAALEKENDNCKCKMKELELVKVERNCLKMRAEDMARIQRDYEELLKKTQGFDALKAECALYKTKYNELKHLEDECNELRGKVGRVEELERERQMLLKEIEDCECCMNNQESEIKRLACHIECLTQDLDKRQDQMKTKVCTMRAHLEKKDCLIAKSEQQLACVQDQLRSSIENLSCETSCLRTRIEELESEAKKLRDLCVKKEEECRCLSESNKRLQKSLDDEKNSNVKMEEALRKAIKSDEHLKQMLKQAKCAIKCISQQLERHDIVGIGRMEAERENYLKKIKELEEGMTEQPDTSDKVAKLEQELSKAKDANKTLRESLDQMKTLSNENEVLKQLSSELQETAKTQKNKLDDANKLMAKKSQELESECVEKDKLIDQLRKEMESLKKELEADKQRFKEMENTLKAVGSAGEISEENVGKLKAQINVLNAEIDRLNFDLETKQKECEETIRKLQAKLDQVEGGDKCKKLEEELADLKTELERYKTENELLKDELTKSVVVCDDRPEKFQDDIKKLKDELEKTKKELAEAKKPEAAMSDIEKENKNLKDELNRLRKELESKESENKKLKEENADLEHDVKMYRKEGEILKEERDKIQKAERDLKDELNRSRQDLAMKENAVKENAAAKEQLEQQLSGKENLEKQNANLKDELAKLRIDCAGKDVLENENKNLRDELRKLEAELAAKNLLAKDEDNDFAKQREDLLKQINDQKKEIADLLNQMKEPAKTEDLSTFQELENKTLENEKLKSTIEDLERQINDLKKGQPEVPAGSPEFERTIKDLRESLEREEARSYDLVKTNQTLQKTVADLQKRLKGCEDECEALRKRIAELEAGGASAGPVDDAASRVKELEAELAKRKQECNDMIASLKEQYDRDIKNLRNQNKASIDQLQKSHQSELNRLSKEFEGSKTKMQNELREKEATLSKMSQLGKKAEPEKEESAQPEEKRKSLSFKTFAEVCICSNLPSVIPIGVPPPRPCYHPRQSVDDFAPMAMQRSGSTRSRSASPPFQDRSFQPADATRHMAASHSMVAYGGTPLLAQKDEKASSFKKIIELENRLLAKQEYTKQKISLLQSTVDKVKRELELERQKNNDLVNRYANQSKTVANMKVEMDLVKRENVQDKKKLQHLNTTLKNILGNRGSSPPCVCPPRMIPHFHTELTVVKNDNNKFKHNCVMKRSCPCDKGPETASELSLNESVENLNVMEAEPLDLIETLQKCLCYLESGEDVEKIEEGSCPEELAVLQENYESLYEDFHKLKKLLDSKNVEMLEFEAEIVDLQNYIMYQEQTIASLQKGQAPEKGNRMKELEENIAKKEHENKCLCAKLQEATKGNGKLKEAMKSAAERYASTLKKVSESKCKCGCENPDNLKAAIREKDEEISSLKLENEELLEQLEACGDYITDQIDEMKKMAQCLDSLPLNLKKAKQKENDKTKLGCPCNRVEKLKCRLNQYKTKLALKEQNNKGLTEKIRHEKRLKKELESAFEKSLNFCQNLLKEAQGCEALKNECDFYKAQLNELQAKAQQVAFVETQNQKLSEEMENIRVLMCQQEHKINDLNQQLNQKEAQICQCEQDIKQLKAETQTSDSEKMCMCNRIQELEKQLDEYESNLFGLERKNKLLEDSLEAEKSSKANIETALDRITQSDVTLKQMLAYARSTIESITKKLEECDNERAEAQKSTQMKISELECRLSVADDVIEKLKDNLEEMQKFADENVAKRNQTEQLYEAANRQIEELQNANKEIFSRSQKMSKMFNCLKGVVREKDETFKELRQEMLCLTQRLDEEQTAREETQNTLDSLSAAGDSEFGRLHTVICCKDEQIRKLKQEIDNLKSTTIVGTMEKKMKILEDERNYLKTELEQYIAYLEDVLTGYVDPKELEVLEKKAEALDHQKRINEEQTKAHNDIMLHLQLKLDKKEEECKHLKEEVRRLSKVRRFPDFQTVIIVEKEIGKDGQPKHNVLGGVEIDKKQALQLESSSILDQMKIRDTQIRRDDPEKAKEIADLKEKLRQVSSHTKELSVKLRRSQQSLSDLEKKLKRSDSEVSRQISQMSMRDMENRALKKEIRRLKEELDDLMALQKSSDPGKATADNIRLRQELRKLKEAIDSKPDDSYIKRLEDKNKELKEEIESLEGEIKRLQGKPQENEAEKKKPSVNSIHEREELLRQIEDQKKQSVDLLAKSMAPRLSRPVPTADEVNELKAENERLKDALREFQSHMEKASTYLMEIPTSANADVEKVVKPLRKAIAMEQKRVAELDELWRNSESKADKLNRQIEALQYDNQYLKKQLDLDAGTLAEQVQRIKVEVMNSLEQAKSGLENTVQVTQLQDLEDQLDDKKKDIEGLRRKLILPLTVDPNDSKTDVLEVCAQNIKTLEQKIRDYQRENNSLRSEIERLQGERLSPLETNVDEPVRQAADDETVRRLKEENALLRMKAKMSKDDLADSQSKPLKQMEKQLSDWQAEHDREIAKMKREVELAPYKSIDLKGCPAHEELVRKLEANLRDYQMQNDVYEKKNIELESENERLTKLLEHMNEEEKVILPMEADEGSMKDLMEHLRNLQNKHDVLKTRTIQLELDNGRLKNDLEKLGKGGQTYEAEMERLREVEQQFIRCTDKYSYLKKRSMKIEIENKNLKQEYINTLIAKEKLALQNKEHTKVLRETNKLLKKVQEKKHSLVKRINGLQMEAENVKAQLQAVLNSDFKEKLAKMDAMEEDMQLLRDENQKLTDWLISLGANVEQQPRTPSRSRADSESNLKIRTIQLELENKQMSKELEELRARGEKPLSSTVDVLSTTVPSDLSVRANDFEKQQLQMRAVELEIENEYLKSELEAKDKQVHESTTHERKVIDLEEEVQRLLRSLEQLKRVNVDLELDNTYLKKEMERIGKIQMGLRDTNEDDLDQRVKIEQLESQVKSLKLQLENMGREQVSLEAHTLQKFIKQVERIVRDFEGITNSGSAIKIRSKELLKADPEALAERLKKWKEEYETQLHELRTSLDKLQGKDSHSSAELERHLKECRASYQRLESDHKNMKMALQILLKEKEVMKNVKLVAEVEHMLEKYDAEAQKRASQEESRKVALLQKQLQDCQGANEILRQEKILLQNHMQDQKIRDLEAVIRQLRMQSGLKERRSMLDLELLKGKDLQDEVQDLMKEKKELRKDLDHYIDENRKIKAHCEAQIKHCENRYEDVRKEKERFQKINELLQKRVNDLEKMLEMRNEDDDAAVKTGKNKNVSFKSIEEQEREIESLKREVLKLYKKCEESKKRISELEDQLEKCRESNKRFKLQLDALKNTNDDDDTIDDFYTSMAKDDNDKSGPGRGVGGSGPGYTKMQLGTADEDIIKIQNRKIGDLEKLLKESEEKYNADVTNMQKLKFGVQGVKEDKSTQSASSGSDENLTKMRIEILRKEVKDKDEENKNLKNELNSLKKLNNALEQKISKMQTKVKTSGSSTKTDADSELQDQIKHLQDENKHLNKATKAQIANLEKLLRKYQNANEHLKRKISKLEGDFYKKNVAKIGERVEKCGKETENLKTLADQLRSENESLRKNLAKMRSTLEVDDSSVSLGFLPHQKRSGDSVTGSELEGDIKKHTKKCKTIITTLTRDYAEHISMLKNQMAAGLPKLVQDQQWHQPSMVQTAYPVPVMWQPPVLPYGYLAKEMEATGASDQSLHLSHLVDKIEKTQRSKKVLRTDSDRSEEMKESFVEIGTQSCEFQEKETPKQVQSAGAVPSVVSKDSDDTRMKKLFFFKKKQSSPKESQEFKNVVSKCEPSTSRGRTKKVEAKKSPPPAPSTSKTSKGGTSTLFRRSL